MPDVISVAAALISCWRRSITRARIAAIMRFSMLGAAAAVARFTESFAVWSSTS